MICLSECCGYRYSIELCLLNLIEISQRSYCRAKLVSSSSKQVETDTCTKKYPLSGIAAMRTRKWKHIQLHAGGVRATDSLVRSHHVRGSRRGGTHQLSCFCSGCCWPGHFQVQRGAPSKVSLRFEAIQSITELPTSLSLSLSWLRCRWSDHDGRLRGGSHESEIREGTGSGAAKIGNPIKSILAAR